MIHRLYRQELSAVARLLEAIRAGQARPGALPAMIAGLTLTENLSVFGTVCGRQCALLQTHHDIEEHHLFPELGAHAGALLRPVLERLIAEHRVIHAQIGDLREAAELLETAPSDAALDACAEAFAALHRSIRSHFGYEEVELAGALGAYEIAL